MWASLPAAAQWGAQGAPGLTQMCHKPLKTGSNLTQRELEKLGATAPSATGVAVSNTVSAHCHMPSQLFFSSRFFFFFLVGWMKSWLCRVKPTKQSWSRVQKSRWKIPILWLFPAQAILPDTFSPVYDWLSQFLVQDKWGKCGDRAHCRELCLWQGWTCLGCEGPRVPSEGHLPLPPASPLTSSKQNQMGVSLR